MNILGMEPLDGSFMSKFRQNMEWISNCCQMFPVEEARWTECSLLTVRYLLVPRILSTS